MPDIAAFDFDGTLTTGGSVFGFLTAVTTVHKVATASVVLSPRLAYAGLAGGTAADQTKERLFQIVLADTESSHLEAVSATFAPHHLARHLRPDVHQRLVWHQKRGDHTVIVSASIASYVDEAGRLLGVDHVIATRLAVSNGRVTGSYEGKNCRGEEKLRRLQAWIAGLDEPLGRLWAYGNSRGDLRMMHAAQVGVNVGRLGPIGRLRAFPGLDPTQTQPHGGG